MQKKKGLLAISSHYATHCGPACQNALWANFLDKYLSKLPVDVEFVVVQGDAAPIYRQLTRGYPYASYNGPSSPNHPKELAQFSFTRALEKGYKYWILFENDAFPSVESLQNICRAFEEDKVDLVINTGYHMAPIPPPHYPWRVQLPGAGMFAGTVSFINSVCKKYGNIWFSCNLSYKKICSILDYPVPELFSSDKAMSNNGGFMGTDLWTYLCAEHPRLGVLVNQDNRSFVKRSGFRSDLTIGGVLKNGVPYVDLLDEEDLTPAIDHYKIIAPFFHPADSRNPGMLIDPNFPLSHISIHNFPYLLGVEILGYAVKEFRCRATLIPSICNKLVGDNVWTREEMPSKLKELKQQVLNIMRGSLKDYISEEDLMGWLDFYNTSPPLTPFPTNSITPTFPLGNRFSTSSPRSSTIQQGGKREPLFEKGRRKRRKERNYKKKTLEERRRVREEARERDLEALSLRGRRESLSRQRDIKIDLSAQRELEEKQSSIMRAYQEQDQKRLLHKQRLQEQEKSMREDKEKQRNLRQERFLRKKLQSGNVS